MGTDTIISAAPSQYEAMLSNYASIVEKTNNQLGLGINLASLAVAILSVFVALIAIFVAIALWKNSKEQNDRMNQFFSEQEKIIKEKNTNLEKVESKFDGLIGEYESRLKDISLTDKESKKQIQQAIDELKKEKISAGAFLAPVSGLQRPLSYTINPTAVSPFQNMFCQKSMVCSKCGKSFHYYDDPSILRLTVGGETVHCTYCGAFNMMQ